MVLRSIAHHPGAIDSEDFQRYFLFLLEQVHRNCRCYCCCLSSFWYIRTPSNFRGVPVSGSWHPWHLACIVLQYIYVWPTFRCSQLVLLAEQMANDVESWLSRATLAHVPVSVSWGSGYDHPCRPLPFRILHPAHACRTPLLGGEGLNSPLRVLTRSSTAPPFPLFRHFVSSVGTPPKQGRQLWGLGSEQQLNIVVDRVGAGIKNQDPRLLRTMLPVFRDAYPDIVYR